MIGSAKILSYINKEGRLKLNRPSLLIIQLIYF